MNLNILQFKNLAMSYTYHEYFLHKALLCVCAFNLNSQEILIRLEDIWIILCKDSNKIHKQIIHWHLTTDSDFFGGARLKTLFIQGFNGVPNISWSSIDIKNF